jgi:proline iminopeptidase
MAPYALRVRAASLDEMPALRTSVFAIMVLLASALLQRYSWRSGASDAEAYGSLPGDHVIPHPMVEWTRATTIEAAPSEVWPWLVQMGYGRGGWYTNEDIDQLIWRVSATNANSVIPEYQDLEVGDIIADGPGHAAYFHVRSIEPERAIVYHSVRHPYRGHPLPDTKAATLVAMEERLRNGGRHLDFSWAFVLNPIDAEHTRLIIRTRANFAPRSLGLLRVPLGWVDLFHAHTILGGIRRRVQDVDLPT